ncbi:MAG: GNVR domain-containing protein [Candidatus Thiodiazotropha sp.]
MNEIIYKIKNYIRSAWRFRWQAIIASWIVAVIGWSVVFTLPSKYASEAKVYVDTESVLRPLLQGSAILVDVNRRPIPGTRETENFYTIAFEYSDRFMAQRVVKVLLDIFVESALGDTRIESDAAQQFLQKQIVDYESRLLEAENKLTEFKRQNVDTLPRDNGGIFPRLETARTELEAVQLEYKEAKIRRDELKNQYDTTLAEEQRRQEQLGISAAADTPMGRRLLAMQTRLDDLLLRYTEEHPDVKELKSKIEELRKQAASQPPSASAPVSRSNTGSTSALEELKLAYRQSEVELRAVTLRRNEYQERVSELKKKLDTLPKVEAELTRLNRNYSINKENYQELVQRLESAKMSERADEAGDSLKFRVVEPPKVPLLPVGPKRLLLSIGTLIVALGIGGALAFLMSQLKPVYFDIRTLSTELEFPVVGQVSRVMTDDVKTKRRMAISGFITMFVLLIVLFVAIVAIYVLGLREDILLLMQQNGLLGG